MPAAARLESIFLTVSTQTPNADEPFTATIYATGQGQVEVELWLDGALFATHATDALPVDVTSQTLRLPTGRHSLVAVARDAQSGAMLDFDDLPLAVAP